MSSSRKPETEPLPGKAWLSIPDYRADLMGELGCAQNSVPAGGRWFGDILHLETDPGPLYWHTLCLERPFLARFQSISEAADILRAVQRNWAHHPTACFRRAELIRQRLPHISEKPRTFPYTVPDSPMGIWTLLDDHTLLASAETSSPFPAGKALLMEDRVNPPSRAYLKLQEALTLVPWLLRKRSAVPLPGDVPQAVLPGPASRCVDAGACPGGWTWVLRQLGAEVTAIDRAELEPRLMSDPEVRFIRHDTFTLSPADFGPTDWVFSDVICYPPRLLEWIEKWLDSGLCRNFICTIKMQGEADHEVTRAFAAIPGSTVLHLGANKHELTWIRIDPDLRG